ncbi:MAG: hypothetical protein G8D61_20810 [gamma proteobacterium symbiont of Ctena orbiculata]|nr:hypothetical protein [Candidatus Thiodiazotropha sp. (ex Lucina pensylvanica)]MBT3061467.1 hypothetical protein [Candidatus Thiodiazotropha sp. (ex Lucina pensylvanica)]MBV2094372.1 hypothetical protein [Candidatus Thiodiazotropha sp. (ex Codakia orbicularis)]PUB74759.1 MAG: hypothetical protein DBP03_08545 [gamma proteobacterium symbiont of Ctena orbiculata]PUB76957.1 MAG: hypothetical protein DBO99_12735 [gamma proteobacterium symbiont of Ctena orbiculata]
MKMAKFSSTIISVALACCSMAWAEEECDKASSSNDYPTSARVDYVIGCMASNGQTHEMMLKCSCSIDLIAKAIPYEEYVHISTLLSLQQMAAAGRNAVYKSSTWSQKAVAKLRDVQADSTLRCF